MRDIAKSAGKVAYAVADEMLRVRKELAAAKKERDSWKAKAEANEQAAHFTAAILKDFFPEMGDCDGLSIADAAIAAGLMYIVDDPSSDDQCGSCDGDCGQCWRFTERGQYIVDGARSGKKKALPTAADVRGMYAEKEKE